MCMRFRRCRIVRGSHPQRAAEASGGIVRRRAIVVDEGLARAKACCDTLAQLLGVAPHQVLPFSTGVIMEPLPHERVIAGLPAALADLDARHWAIAALAGIEALGLR